MSFEEMLAQQFNAFHAAIVDSCDRSNRPQQTDAMALRLRNNALAMTKLQLTLLPLACGAGAQTPPEAEPLPHAKHAQGPAPMPNPEPDWTEPEPWPETESLAETTDPETAAHAAEPARDHVLAGDALSRFVSRRIDPAESAYQAWHDSLREATSGPRRDATQLHGGQASGRWPPDVKPGST